MSKSKVLEVTISLVEVRKLLEGDMPAGFRARLQGLLPDSKRMIEEKTEREIAWQTMALVERSPEGKQLYKDRTERAQILFFQEDENNLKYNQQIDELVNLKLAEKGKNIWKMKSRHLVKVS